MYLKKLTLSGFKSFADTTELEFHPGTTGIVGPNGCGKSNVVDAFRWVLGERRVKELRGSEMLDVIFKGTASRKPVGRAEVTLLFDNADGALPIEFAEVEVGRRLFRSGESEYLINRRRVRLKDVQALFADTGIGTEGYSILEQGAVDAILHANAQQRREIFEEAAGISRFKKQKVQAMRKLDRVEADLQRSEDILREVERRARSVKIQAGKARRFLEDRESLRRVRTLLAREDIVEYRTEREELTFDLAYLEARREMLSELGNHTAQGRDSARRGLDQANQSLNTLRGEEMKLRVEVERIGQRRAHIEESREEMEQAAGTREKQLQELLEVEEEYSGRRQEVRQGLRNEISNLRGVREQFDATDQKRQDLVDRKNELEGAIRSSKDEALSHLFTETRINNERTSQEAEDRGLEALSERRTRERDEFKNERENLEGSIETLAQERSECERERQHLGERRVALEDELGRRDAQLSETQRAVSDLRGSVQEQQARLKFLEELEESREGIGQGVVRLLETDEPIRREIVGLLASCLEASPEIAPLVDAVLGSFSEAVVFEGGTPLEARARVVESILEGDGVTFCQALAPNGERPPHDPNEGQPLIELVSCNRQYRPLLERVFAGVFVVDSLERALELVGDGKGHRRYVTRCGHLVEPWGAVTSQSSQKGGLVSRHAEIQQLHHGLGGHEDKLAREEERQSELEIAIEARRDELRSVREGEQRLALKVESLDRRTTEVRREVQRTDERLQLVEGELVEIAQTRQRVQAELAGIADKLASVSEERVRLEESVADEEVRLEELNEQLMVIEHELGSFRVSATQGEERILALRREEMRIVGEINERHVRRVYLQDEERRAEERKQAYSDEEAQLDEHQATHDESLARLAKRMEDGEAQVEGRRQEVEHSEAVAEAIVAHDDELRQEREQALMRESEIGFKISNIREKLVEEFEIELSEAPIDEWRSELSAEDETEEQLIARIREELPKIQERLRKNANVNLEAVNELDELEERQEHLSSQMADINDAKQKLMDTIGALNETSREKFTRTFESVRANFRELFRKVFEGGTADLTLEADVDVLEAGVEITARPPGKRISSLKLLSGGEKALTATAVLFALFRHKPSPFCLLDEVDAPLDEANIRRFIRILKEFTDDSQFLIITHSKATMSEAERLYGITMEERGVSRQVSVKLEEAAELAKDNPANLKKPVSLPPKESEAVPEAIADRMSPKELA